MNDLTAADAAYLAGLFDGEGTVGIYSKQSKVAVAPVYTLTLSIANTDRPLFEELQDAWDARTNC